MSREGVSQKRKGREALATYPDRAELKREYPELEDEDMRQALEFAALGQSEAFMSFLQERLREHGDIALDEVNTKRGM